MINVFLSKNTASGFGVFLQQFSYGNMGEITEIIRTFVMPNQQGNGPITLAMQFEYDREFLCNSAIKRNEYSYNV
jgi:hypothetical protein